MGPIRRNKPHVTATGSLDKAISLIKKVKKVKKNSGLQGIIRDIKSCQKEYCDKLVSVAEAQQYSEGYVKFYLQAGFGVLVPPFADVFFEGMHDSITFH
jgi:hypothetical protein